MIAHFHRLGARVGEEHRVGEGRVDEALRQSLAVRDPEKVRRVPDLLALLGQRLDEMGMRIAQRRDRDAAAEIEISRAVGVREPGPFTFLEGDVGARIGRQNGRDQGIHSGKQDPDRDSDPEKESAARKGRHHDVKCSFSRVPGQLTLQAQKVAALLFGCHEKAGNHLFAGSKVSRKCNSLGKTNR